MVQVGISTYAYYCLGTVERECTYKHKALVQREVHSPHLHNLFLFIPFTLQFQDYTPPPLPLGILEGLTTGAEAFCLPMSPYSHTHTLTYLQQQGRSNADGWM